MSININVSPGVVLLGQANTWTQPQLFAVGTAAAPSMTFSGDTDTGIYRVGADILGITAAGALVASFQTGLVGFVNGASLASAAADGATLLLVARNAAAATQTVLTVVGAATVANSYITAQVGGTWTLAGGQTWTIPAVTLAGIVTGGVAGGVTIYGGAAANDDLTLEGTSHATKTSSYVILQPNGGNVGIGTTGPKGKLQLGAYTIIDALDGGSTSTDFTHNLYYSAGSWKYLNTAAAVLIQIDSGNIKFWTTPSGTADNAATLTERMRLSNAGGLSLGSGYVGTDAGAGNMIIAGNVGIGNSAPGALLDLGLAGTTAGVMRLAGATSGNVTITVAAVAGAWTMKLPTAVGTAGFQLTDAAGDGVCSWAAAGSRREWKELLGAEFGIKPVVALEKILELNVVPFKFKPGYGTGDTETIYQGVLADEAPWLMHYQGGVLNPISSFGHVVLAIQAMNQADWLIGQLQRLCENPKDKQRILALLTMEER